MEAHNDHVLQTATMLQRVAHDPVNIDPVNIVHSYFNNGFA